MAEVNASPGFEGLDRVCGVDAAGAILDHAERLAGGLEPRRGRPFILRYRSRGDPIPLIRPAGIRVACPLFGLFLLPRRESGGRSGAIRRSPPARQK